MKISERARDAAWEIKTFGHARPTILAVDPVEPAERARIKQDIVIFINDVTEIGFDPKPVLRYRIPSAIHHVGQEKFSQALTVASRIAREEREAVENSLGTLGEIKRHPTPDRMLEVRRDTNRPYDPRIHHGPLYLPDPSIIFTLLPKEVADWKKDHFATYLAVAEAVIKKTHPFPEDIMNSLRNLTTLSPQQFDLAIEITRQLANNDLHTTKSFVRNNHQPPHLQTSYFIPRVENASEWFSHDQITKKLEAVAAKREPISTFDTDELQKRTLLSYKFPDVPAELLDDICSTFARVSDQQRLERMVTISLALTKNRESESEEYQKRMELIKAAMQQLSGFGIRHASLDVFSSLFDPAEIIGNIVALQEQGKRARLTYHPEISHEKDADVAFPGDQHDPNFRDIYNKNLVIDSPARITVEPAE
jgi:hypothetical protein